MSYLVAMRRFLFAIPLAVTCLVSTAADREFIEGTWGYHGGDASLQVHLDHGGDCFVTAASAASVAGYFVKCTYTLQWPYVEIGWQRDKDGVQPGPLHLVLVGNGELMRLEGEARRPLRRDWEVPPPAPNQVNLGEPGAMAALEKRDPDGYRKVVRMIDLVTRFGCRGAFLGEIKALVKWEFIACRSMDDPPATSRIGFWLGDARYLIDIPPR